MNLLLLFEEDFKSENKARLSGRRAEHIRSIHRAEKGKVLQTGMLNGKQGTGLVVDIADDYVDIEVSLTEPPPESIPLTLICALPRPQSFKKVLETGTAMGVKQFYFTTSRKVEKSYWQSPVLNEDSVFKHIVMGLEQGKDTVLPKVEFRQKFKPFVEDETPSLIKDAFPMIAHPAAGEPCPHKIGKPVVLAIGPEGGFSEYEVELFIANGFNPFNLGARILRVEYALTALLAKLY